MFHKKKNPNYKNAFFDEANASIKFIRNNKVVYDDMNLSTKEGLSVSTFSTYVNQYNFRAKYQTANMILLNSEELAITFITSFWA